MIVGLIAAAAGIHFVDKSGDFEMAWNRKLTSLERNTPPKMNILDRAGNLLKSIPADIPTEDIKILKNLKFKAIACFVVSCGFLAVVFYDMLIKNILSLDDIDAYMRKSTPASK